MYVLEDVIAAVQCYITHREVEGKGREESVSRALLDVIDKAEARRRRERALAIQAEHRREAVNGH